MKKKKYVKLCLDLVMLIVLLLLCRKNVISLMFHEIAGLCVLGAFLVHLLLNRKWIGAATKRLFDSKLSTRVRFSYILNALLGLSLLLCGVCGILISKRIFPFHLTAVWIPLHFFAAALSILLLGVHLGMHLQMIGNALPFSLPRAAAAALSVILVLGGVYGYSGSSMSRWLQAPFSVQETGSHGQDLEVPKDGDEGSVYGRGYGEGGHRGEGYGEGEHRGKGGGKGYGRQQAGENGMPEGRPGNGEGNGKTGTFSLAELGKLLAVYGSIVLGISVITFWLDKGIRLLRAKRV